MRTFDEFLNEASRRKVHKAAKQGSYPAVIIVVQDGKVIHQEPVSTPDVAPAAFNVMQEKYPKAILHLEDKTGKRLFTESVVYNSSNTKPIAAKKAKKEFGDLLPKANKGIPPYEFAVIKTRAKNYRLVIKSGDYIAHEFMTNLKDDGILTAEIVKAAVDNIIKLNPDEFNESVVTEAKTLDRDEMMDWLEGHLSFVRTSEEFDGAKGGIWTSGENGEEWKGKVIYAYYSEDYKNRTFGVLNSWEKELNKRGWYSEWYDAGTVMIWPI